MKETVRLFSNDLEAHYVRRPNRFLIIAEKNGKELACHCPNPGRLSELLFRGTDLILEKRCKPGTEWTAAALKREGPGKHGIVPLYSSRANNAAEKLVLPKILPGLNGIQREYRIGDSRFDFFCTTSDGKQHLVEVKACSLVEHGVAMFPDAPSARALKHLEELANLSGKGFQCHVLFVIMHGKPGVFIPNVHTDPALAAALCRYGGNYSGAERGRPAKVNIHTALIHCRDDGRASLAPESIPIDLGAGLMELALSDGGNYLVLLNIDKPCTIEAGSLGKLDIKKGWYVYSGSARKNLSARIARHQRKLKKQKHWHLDYLTPWAQSIKTLPFMTFYNLECELAEDLKKLGGTGVRGFGCSDCRCASHLYYFSEAPQESRDFQNMIFRYRHVECFKRN